MNSNNINYYNLRKEIVDKADIVAIIGKYISLEKKGSNYIGLCPFHKDTNPSLSVSPEKKVFKCFSCNVAGDVVTFVSKIENISIRDAMRKVGETCGIKVTATKKELEKQKNEKYYKIMEDTAKFYNFYLTNTTNAKAALDYLHNRGLNDDIIKKFNIGASPDDDKLFKLLEASKYLPIDMIELGLVKSYNNEYHDVYKNRIIFPICDLDGYVCGLSGRRYLENDDSSKYVNSVENVIFKKSFILYNYHNAVPSIKEEDNVYLFEGFMDVIASVRAGFNNSVASMGTALTNGQIEAIKRLTNNVTICYDSDLPGINATLRAISLFNNYSMNVSILTIPDGKDPDEYIKKNGEEKLHDYLLNNKVNAFDFIYAYYFKNLNINDVNSVEEFKNNIFENIKNVKSNSLIETYIKKISNDINISYESLTEDFNNYKVNHQEFRQNNYSRPNNNYDIPPIQDDNQAYDTIDDLYQDEPKVIKKGLSDYKIKPYLNSERKLILVSYNQKDKCLEIESKLNYAFVDKINREILFKIREFYLKREVMNKDDFFKCLTEEEKEILINILNDETAPAASEIDMYIDRVREFTIIQQIDLSKSSNTTKTCKDLKDLAEMKKKVTTIKQRRMD